MSKCSDINSWRQKDELWVITVTTGTKRKLLSHNEATTFPANITKRLSLLIGSKFQQNKIGILS